MALLATLVDNFNDNTQDVGLWNVGKIPGDAASCTGVTVAETGGQLQVTPRSSTAGTYYCGYVSVATYDMTASGAYARFVQNTSSSVGVESVFKLGSGVSDLYSYSFYTAGGSLYARARVNGVNTDVANAVYNATNHAWLRIRESGGTIYWDVAPDSTGLPGAWVNFASRAVDAGFDKTAVYFHVGAGTWQSVATPGVAIWDSVNAGNTTFSRSLGASAVLSEDYDAPTTVTKTFPFATTTEGFSGTPGNASTTMAEDAGVGNPAGALKTATTGKSKTSANYWEWSGTWESLGVPAGSKVTAIRLNSHNYQVPTYAFGATASTKEGPFELRDSGGALLATLWAGAAFTGVLSWQTVAAQADQSVAVPNQRSYTSIRIRLNSNTSTGANNGGAVTLHDDNLSLVITYAPPHTGPAPRVVSATAVLKALGVARTAPASAALRATLSRAVPATAILATRSSRAVLASAALTAVLKRTVTASAALQATLKRSAPASAALKATRTRSAAASAALLGHYTRAVAASAVLALTGARFSRTVPASAILATRNTRSLAATAALAATLSRTTTASASLKSVFTRSLASSAALVGRSSRSLASSAYLSPAAVIGSPHAHTGGEGAPPGGGVSGAGSKSGVRTPLVRVGARRV